jgi:hypothetical protein
MEWLKDKSGYSIFINRVLKDGSLVEPANQTESENNSVLINLCDFQLSWSTVDNLDILVAVAYETLHNIVPQEEIESWTQTCRL